MSDDYCYLCCNCGEITPFEDWTLFHYTEDGGRRPHGRNDSDPVCECPVCLWEHIDDDSGSGMYDGTRAVCEAEREALLRPRGPHEFDGWAENWAEVMAEVKVRGQR